jgi:hypothetical protein
MTHSTQYYHEPITHNVAAAVSQLRLSDSESLEMLESEDGHERTPAQPSAKALGKRRAAPPPEDSDCMQSHSSTATISLMTHLIDTAAFDPDDLFYEHTNESRRSVDFDEEEEESPGARVWHHPVHYVYDAAAERMKERLQEGRLPPPPTTPGIVH